VFSLHLICSKCALKEAKDSSNTL